MKRYSTHVLALLLLYLDRKSLVFNVLGVVIYLIIDNNVFQNICFNVRNRNCQRHKMALEALFILCFQTLAFLKCCWA